MEPPEHDRTQAQPPEFGAAAGHRRVLPLKTHIESETHTAGEFLCMFGNQHDRPRDCWTIR